MYLSIAPSPFRRIVSRHCISAGILLCGIFSSYVSVHAAQPDTLRSQLLQNATVLNTASDLDPLIDLMGSKKFVLLGESSHGTSEYYTWRSRISQRLITEKEFTFIAVEGDWSSAYEVNRYVKNLPGAPQTSRDALAAFNRWPRWMWRNMEIVELIEWLREYNNQRPYEKKIGFYGFDLYSMWSSIHEVIRFFEENDPDNVDAVRSAYSCFLAFDNQMREYATYALQKSDCHAGVADVVTLLHKNSSTYKAKARREYYNAKINAQTVLHGESHIRLMAFRGAQSWNSRVHNFKNTVEILEKYYGSNSRGIIWAHNTHVGDARATTMAANGQENIGQLFRINYGPDKIGIVGFGTFRGTVLAGSAWNAPVHTMTLPPAVKNSIEEILSHLQLGTSLFMLNSNYLPAVLSHSREHRAKGVVYDPSNESGNYVPTILSQRYDAFIFIDETTALKALD